MSGKFPSFPVELTLCAKLVQKGSCKYFEVLPPYYVTIIQNLSPIPHIYILNTTILTQKIFLQFPSFPEELTLCAKLGQKLCFSYFQVLPPDYVTINQNISPVPQIYIPNTTILTEENFSKISQFFRKTYIVCKIATRIENR